MSLHRDPHQFVSKYLRLWIAIAVLAAVLRALNLIVTHAHPSDLVIFSNRALRITTFWLLYPAFLPSIFWSARRFPLEPPHGLRDTAVHMLGVVLFSFVHMLAVSFLTLGFRPSTSAYLGWYLPVDLVAYWAAVCALHYYYEVQDREVLAERLRADLTEVRLRALRSQLNPHFLFNTLNTISVLALKGDNGAVLSVVNRLSTLLRRALDETVPQEIELAEELECVADYLEIQRVRFADRLVLQWDIAPDTMNASVPAMVLQPLIENAIKHGVAAYCGAGVVTVRSRLKGRSLVLQVLNTVAAESATTPHLTSTGIGLSNTQSRLQHLYGAEQHFEYGPSASGGVEVTLTIPFRQIRSRRFEVA